MTERHLPITDRFAGHLRARGIVRGRPVELDGKGARVMRRTGLLFALVVLASGGFASSALAGSLAKAWPHRFSSQSPLLSDATPTPFSAAFSPSSGRLATADPGYDAVTMFAVKQSIRSFSAVPAQLASSGGKVKLEAAVRGAAGCRFSSANSVNGLPARKDCASGGASVTITLPANTTSAARAYKFELTARSAAGKRITKHVTVVEMLKPVAQPQPSAGQPVAPQITVEPQSQNVAVDSQVWFTAASSGVPTPSVQWCDESRDVSQVSRVMCLGLGSPASGRALCFGCASSPCRG
jgi:hypothetical protein